MNKQSYQGERMVSSWTSLVSWIKERLIRWRWGIIGLFGAIIFLLELVERAQLDLIHLSELFLFALLLIIIGGLIEMLLRALNEKDRANTILDLKHKISLNLALNNDIQELNTSLMESLSSITQPLMSSLTVYDPLSEKFETVVEWESSEASQISPHLAEPLAACQSCGMENLNRVRSITTCRIEQDASTPDGINGYCLPLIYGTSMVGLLRFRLSPGKSLSPPQLETIQNINTEMAIAIKSVQQAQALTEVTATKAVLAERREISQDLHDVLGHNISYLRLKLDQFSQDEYQGTISQVREELKEMRDVADDSYELVRGVLETLHPFTPIPLANLLLNHIRSIADRPNFEYKFATQGVPRPLTAQASRQIFFAFMEAMRNLSKHSGARNGEINLLWGKDDLTIRIYDDGCGFVSNSQPTGQHFGLPIMQERIEAMGGRFSIKSAAGEGTEVIFSLPLKAIQEIPKDEVRMQDASPGDQIRNT